MDEKKLVVVDLRSASSEHRELCSGLFQAIPPDFHGNDELYPISHSFGNAIAECNTTSNHDAFANIDAHRYAYPDSHDGATLSAYRG